MVSLVLITHSFPYDFVEPFLETEIVYLAERLDRVIVVPSRVRGVPRSVPNSVEVETSLGQTWPYGAIRGLDSLVAALTSHLFYRECLAHAEVLTHWEAFARLIAYIGDMIRTYRWALQYFSQPSVNVENTIVYTYWLGPISLGIGLIKEHYPRLKLVSRAHRIDLYEEIHPRSYLPLRRETYSVLDTLFAVSDHGQRYLLERYPSVASHIQVARLGVNDPGSMTLPSQDGVFRIVSCSGMRSAKRLHLVAEAIRLLALQKPNHPMEWHHFGDGELRQKLEATARDTFPPHVHWIFHGQIPNKEVIAFYRANPIDVFVNVSSSEGIPVSIMEAQSCGIPVIATAVGGTPEIVNNENGVLLESNPTPHRIALAMNQLASSRNSVMSKRQASKSTWESMYNAQNNYFTFAEQLIQLFGRTSS